MKQLNDAVSMPVREGSARSTPRFPIVEEIREGLRDLFEARELLYQLIRRDIAIRYKQAIMGYAWAILTPALVVMAGVVVRLAIAKVGGHRLEPGAIAGILSKSGSWSFFVTGIGAATPSLSGNLNLVTKIQFPREVLTMASVLGQGRDFLVSSAVVAVAMAFLGVHASWALLWVPVLVVLLVLLTVGLGLILACGNLFFRDVKYIVQVVLSFGIFFTPVFFEPAMFGPKAGTLLMLNPVAPILEGLRLSIVEGHNLLRPLMGQVADGSSILLWSPWWLAYTGLLATVGLALAWIFFRRLSYLFAEYV